MVFDVKHEKVRGVTTREAAARDAYLDANAVRIAAQYSIASPAVGWAEYLRDEVRNALAHVNRSGGRRKVNPDDPSERVRLRHDAALMRNLAHDAIQQRWPHAVTVTPR